MLLMVDNYDSFTFNLVHYFRKLGQQVEVVRNDQVSIQLVQQLKPKYLVISPGPCDPDKAGQSLALINEFAGDIPLLGVCLGHQCIAQHFGATVVRARQVMHGKNSLIYHDNTTLFNGLPNPLNVTRYHSLVVKADTLPACLRVTAATQTPQGQSDEIMALAHQHLPIYGVQFHPESIMSEAGLQLLDNFLQL